jgi:hypothetical protein
VKTEEYLSPKNKRLEMVQILPREYSNILEIGYNAGHFRKLASK